MGVVLCPEHLTLNMRCIQISLIFESRTCERASVSRLDCSQTSFGYDLTSSTCTFPYPPDLGGGGPRSSSPHPPVQAGLHDAGFALGYCGDENRGGCRKVRGKFPGPPSLTRSSPSPQGGTTPTTLRGHNRHHQSDTQPVANGMTLIYEQFHNSE